MKESKGSKGGSKESLKEIMSSGGVNINHYDEVISSLHRAGRPDDIVAVR
jgi:hypothetical protein